MFVSFCLFAQDTMTAKRVIFRWTPENDEEMLKLVAAYKPTNPNQWEEIAKKCEDNFGNGKPISTRAVKERFRSKIAAHKQETRINLAK